MTAASQTSNSQNNNNSSGLTRYLSAAGVWALSFGCAVGWGAFVMPGTTFLPLAGPAGTAAGIGIGAVIMLIIGINYNFLINRYPDAGGTLTYAAKTFGYDHGFISSWFLILVYVAIMWANATALVLIFRNLAGDIFQFGFHYQVMGYDVYAGEIILSVTAIVLVSIICMKGKRLAVWMQIILAVTLFIGIAVCFCAVTGKNAGGTAADVSPAFSPSGENPAVQVLRIVILAPWAFAGFESVSHSAEEFRFSSKKTIGLIIAALITSALSYILLSFISVSALPGDCADWADYTYSLDSRSGLEALPAFYATNSAMGSTGLTLLGITLFAAVFTGIIGNLIAAGRLLYTMARENILPGWFGRLNKDAAPQNAILFLMLISLAIPFLGRTTIGWIIDVNTIGATIAYGYTSAAAFKAAGDSEHRSIRVTGIIGTAVSIGFFIYFMAFSAGAMSAESYLILAAWSILGFVFFRYVFRKDTSRRFGKSTVVWIALLFLIFFTSLMWVRQATDNMTKDVVTNISAYYEERNPENDPEAVRDTEQYLSEQMEEANRLLTRNSIIQMCLIIAALAIMFSIYKTMSGREKAAEIEKIQAEQSNRAKSAFLSNMSHDIRTPMNAIVGYTDLAMREDNIPPKIADFLRKIKNSSRHLLALINDVLEMSRIESGKMELEPEQISLERAMDEVRDMFAAQMETKKITYNVNCENLTDKWVMCDKNRLDRALLNLISNAYKFTPGGGSVNVTLTQTGAADGTGSYKLSIKDSGIGMSPEFAARVFEAFEREKTSTVSKIQGTGLGMAITKSIIDLMGGTIDVFTEQGKGTEFVINASFPLTEPAADSDSGSGHDNALAEDIDFSGMKLLLAEDNEINREIASLILEEAGFALDTAENGQIAVDKVRGSAPGEYSAVLMDIEMPVMNGYEATRAIRGLSDTALANIPIIAISANAFAEDIQASRDAGMDAHISKPIDISKMMETLAEILRV